MDTNDAVKAMMEAAIKTARESHISATTPEARAAYARGVRSMAGLVSACKNVADEFARKYEGHPYADVMFAGYAKALGHIVNSAEHLIPDGYEP